MGARVTDSPEALALRQRIIQGLAAHALFEAGRWFNANDPEAERYYPSYKLQAMAEGELLEPSSLHAPAAFGPETSAPAFAELDALIRDALAYRATTRG